VPRGALFFRLLFLDAHDERLLLGPGSSAKIAAQLFEGLTLGNSRSRLGLCSGIDDEIWFDILLDIS
jgi:hypothetical protein